MAPDGTVEYIVNSLAWSVVGAGIALIYQRLREKKPMVVHDQSKEVKKTSRFRPNWLLLLAAAILVFSVLSTAVSWNTDRRQRDFVACQASVNQDRTDALNDLFQIGVQDRAAVDALVLGVTQATTAAESRKVLATYAKTRADNEADRKEHPLPQPDFLCGNLPE